MSLFNSTDSASNGISIKIYNGGAHTRDFTYIDDIKDEINSALNQSASTDNYWCGSEPSLCTSNVPSRLNNIGSNCPHKFIEYIDEIEECIGIPLLKEWLPLQPSEMIDAADEIKDMRQDFGFEPTMDIWQGLAELVAWYRKYYKIL